MNHDFLFEPLILTPEDEYFENMRLGYEIQFFVFLAVWISELCRIFV